jgi:hypothetical protein
MLLSMAKSQDPDPKPERSHEHFNGFADNGAIDQAINNRIAHGSTREAACDEGIDDWLMAQARKRVRFEGLQAAPADQGKPTTWKGSAA